MVVSDVSVGRIRGIQLPLEGSQQVIAQYVDDTSFMLFGEERPVRNLIYTLDSFCLASGLVLNWLKSCGYWKDKEGWGQLTWTDQLGVSWADGNGMSKLLGAPFGISLSTADVDDFLLEKLTKKLTHWRTSKINTTGQSTVVNSILLSSLFYFISIWEGTNQGIKRIKSAVMNYMAAGTMQRAWIWVSWIQCCQSKEAGGLNIINPEDAVVSLMEKWIIKAMEPGNSNLHLLLQFRLGSYQPFSNGNWQPSLEYFTRQGHQTRRGSIVWSRISAAWKSLLSEVEYVRPKNRDELASYSFWHCPLAPTIGPIFSKTRAAGLHKNRLRRYKDV
jgi:hypothetical protein